MVKAETSQTETQCTNFEQYTPKQPETITYKLNIVLTSRTLRDITNKLDPYKQNPPDSPLTTLTHKRLATITLSKYYNLCILTYSVSHNHPKQFEPLSTIQI